MQGHVNVNIIVIVDLNVNVTQHNACMYVLKYGYYALYSLPK